MRPAQRLTRLNVDGRVDLNLTSVAAGVTRHYDFAADIQQDATDARVFSGIHFRTADEVAIVMGTQVANWALEHHPRTSELDRGALQAGRNHTSAWLGLGAASSALYRLSTGTERSTTCPSPKKSASEPSFGYRVEELIGRGG